MAATLTPAIAGPFRVNFAVAGARGPIVWRYGDGIQGQTPAVGGAYTYNGAGWFHVVGVDRTTGQALVCDVVFDADGNAPGAPVLDSIAPTEVPAGPPSDLQLHLYGSGFTPVSQVRFGAELEEWRVTNVLRPFVSPGELILQISGGLFPGANPAIPVTAINPVPGGGESDPLDFAFV
jgi:hypothetical protein